MCFTFTFVKCHSGLWKVLYKSKELLLLWTHSLAQPQCCRFVCLAFSPLPHDAAVGCSWTSMLTPLPLLRLARRFGVSQTSTGSSRSSLENGGRERDRSSGSDDDEDDDSLQQNTSDAGRGKKSNRGNDSGFTPRAPSHKKKKKTCVSAVVCVPSARSRLDSRLQGLQRDGVANPRRVGQLAGGCSWGAGNRLGQLHRVPAILRVS